MSLLFAFIFNPMSHKKSQTRVNARKAFDSYLHGHIYANLSLKFHQLNWFQILLLKLQSVSGKSMKISHSIISKNLKQFLIKIPHLLPQVSFTSLNPLFPNNFRDPHLSSPDLVPNPIITHKKKKERRKTRSTQKQCQCSHE